MRIFDFDIRLPRFSRKERRRAERIKVFEALYLDYRSPSPGLSGSAPSKDISAIGIRFLSEHKLSKGTSLDLRLRFTPGSIRTEKLRVRATVVRCHRLWRKKKYRVACVFDDLDTHARQEIQNFVSWLREREKKYLHFRWQP